MLAWTQRLANVEIVKEKKIEIRSRLHKHPKEEKLNEEKVLQPTNGEKVFREVQKGRKAKNNQEIIGDVAEKESISPRVTFLANGLR